RRGHCPVDDADRAEKAGHHERLAPRPRRQGLRPADQRGEPPARAVPRDAEDDEEGRQPARWRGEVPAEYVRDEVTLDVGRGTLDEGVRHQSAVTSDVPRPTAVPGARGRLAAAR